MGWGRTSCMFCIFGSHNMWATLDKIVPLRLNYVEEQERKFGRFHLENCTKEGCKICKRLRERAEPINTIHHTLSIRERVMRGTPFDLTGKKHIVDLALSEEYYAEIYMPDWKYPAGAFSGETSGPT